MSAFEIRQLKEQDWKDFRAARLEALRNHPSLFLAAHDETEARPASWWQQQLAEESSAIFGLYEHKRIIGLTAVFTWRGDPGGKTAILAMSHVDPAYRGRRLSRLFYEARIGWARQQGRFEKIRVSHREGNEASRRANQAFGFRFIGKAMIQWPDGTEDWEHNYELDLKEAQP